MAAAVINSGVYALAECLNTTEPICPTDGNVVSSIASSNLKVERGEKWRVTFPISESSLDGLYTTGTLCASPGIPITYPKRP